MQSVCEAQIKTKQKAYIKVTKVTEHKIV